MYILECAMPESKPSFRDVQNPSLFTSLCTSFAETINFIRNFPWFVISLQPTLPVVDSGGALSEVDFRVVHCSLSWKQCESRRVCTLL